MGPGLRVSRQDLAFTICESDNRDPGFARDLRGRDSRRQPTAGSGKPLPGKDAGHRPTSATRDKR